MSRSLAPLYGAAFVLAVETAGAGHLFPALESATHAPPRGGSWFLSVYMFGSLVGAPLLERIAAKRGRAEVITASLALFAMANVLVGLSSSYALTLAARFLQGLAGSAVMPLGAAYLSAVTPAGKQGRELSLLSLSYSGGFLAGMAFVSLFLLFSFRLAYFFTGALAAVATVSVARLPRGAVIDEGQPSPSITTIMAWFLALGLVSWAVNHATLDAAAFAALPRVHRWTVRAAQIGALPALVAFVLRDRSARAALLPRDLFRSRIGIASSALAIATGLGQACVVVLPACAIVQLDVSAAASGPLLLPVVVGGLGTNILTSARLDRWGPKPFLAGGILFIALGNLVVASFGTSFVAFEIGALFLGTGVSATSSGPLRYLVTAYGSGTDTTQGAVSLLTNVGVLLGSSLWGAVVATTADATAATVRGGLLALTGALLPLVFAVLLVRRR